MNMKILGLVAIEVDSTILGVFNRKKKDT